LVQLPSNKNEEIIKELDALTNSNIKATWTQAEAPKAPKTTGEDESMEETPSKNVAPENDTNAVPSDQTTTVIDPNIKEKEEDANVQLTGDDLRISRLSDEELGKEALP